MIFSSRSGSLFDRFACSLNCREEFSCQEFSGLVVLPEKNFQKISRGINAIIGSYFRAVMGEAVPVPGIYRPYAKIPAGFNIPSRAVTNEHGFTGAGIQYLER